VPAEPSDHAPVEAGLERLVAEASRDLAARLSVAREAIDVLEARAVTWPDAALGCSRPGMRAKQVPTDGALIRLRAGGREYEYHSGGGREPFLCEPGGRADRPSGGPERPRRRGPAADGPASPAADGPAPPADLPPRGPRTT